MEKFTELNNLKDTLSVLAGVKRDKVVSDLCKVIEYLASPDINKQIFPEALKLYTEMCEELYKKEPSASLTNYMYDLILYDENIFSKMCAKNKIQNVSNQISEAFKKDVRTIRLLSTIDCDEIISGLIKNNPVLEKIKESIPTYSNAFKHAGKKDVWENYTGDFVRFYLKNGTGEFAKHYAYKVDEKGNLTPVLTPDTVRLSDLKYYEPQKQKANDNILSFLAGNKYNNVLMYGDRGTGKSSCVKALANEYAEVGLRIIQLEKDKLRYLGDLLSNLTDNPLKFLIFIDDLTFSEDDENLNILKAVLEGSLTSQPSNVVIYATSNRKHIVKETFSAREGDEVHRQDTIDEMMSLSDRFGLMITYQMPSKEVFLEITRILAKERGINEPFEQIAEGVEQFALARGFRSPRIAKQFLDLMYKQ